MNLPRRKTAVLDCSMQPKTPQTSTSTQAMLLHEVLKYAGAMRRLTESLEHATSLLLDELESTSHPPTEMSRGRETPITLASMQNVMSFESATSPEQAPPFSIPATFSPLKRQRRSIGPHRTPRNRNPCKSCRANRRKVGRATS